MKRQNYKLRSLLVLMLLAICINANAQFNIVAAYPFTPGTHALSYVSNGTTLSNLLGDDRTDQNIPIGFTFYYAGSPYTTLSACSNGWLSLGNSSSTTYSNTESNMNAISPALMPLFDDLTGQGSNSVASYITTGTAPNRVFTFEWKNWSPLSNQNIDITIQVKLYEGSANAIEFLYKNEAGSGALSSATIGLVGATTGDYQLLNSSGANPTVNTSSFVSSITKTPATDQSYYWDNGPICDQPIALTVTGLNSQSATVDWTHPTGAGALNYEYYVDKQATVTIPASTSTTTNNSITVNSLSPSTQYWLHVRRICSANNVSQWDAISFTTFPECSVPGKIQVSAVDSTSVSFVWGGVQTAVNYEYIIDNSRNAPASGAAATPSFSTALSLSNLQPGTMYYVHVRSLCAGIDSSAWMLDSFYIPRACRAPQISITNLSTSQGVVSWLTVITADEYEYAVTSSPVPPALGTKVANTSVYVPYLNSGTTYYAHVRTFCDDRDVKTISGWTTVPFDTYPVSVNSISGDKNILSVYPNPANDVVNVSIDAAIGNNAAIQVVDITGKTIKSVNVSQKQTAIDINELPSGVYLIKYSDDEVAQVIKFTKQ